MKTFLLILSSLFSLAVLGQTNTRIYQGNEFYRNAQYDLAEREYREALGSGNNTNARYNLANALYRQKKYDEAIRHFSEMGAKGSDNRLRASSWYNAGVAHTKLKDWPAAIEAFKHSLRLDPGDQQARENLQKALLELKKQQQQQKKKEQEQQKNPSKMSRREAEQRLKLLQEREKQLQQRLQNRSRQTGSGQAKDW